MSAGEIDSLEIKISAESAEAAKHIIDLANSLDALSFSASTSVGHLKDLSKTLQGLKFPSGIKAFSNNAELLTQSLNSLSGVDTSSIQGIARNTESLSRISENLKELKVGDRTQESIAQLRRAIVGLDSVSTNVNIDAAADNIQTAVNKLNDVDVSGAVSSLTRLTPQLEAVTNALTGIESASYNFGELSNQIQTLSQSISVIGMSDIGNADDIVDFLTNLQSVHIDSDFAKNLNSIGKAMNNMSKAEPNENAADSLRLFIDTVRIITDDDIARLNAIADAAQNLSVTNIEMPDGSNVSPIPNDVLDSMRNFFSVTEQAAAATNGAEQSASRFSIRLNDVARSAAAVAGTMTRAVLAPVTRITDGFKNATKKAGEFLSGIKRIAMYRAIRSAIKSISEGFKEGRENLYQYSLLAGTKFAESMDKAATASLYLKNSIGAATAPITNYLVPIIDKAVDHIVELINKFNELTATLLKQDTWTKALKYPTKWADAADDATKSAKKLKNAMLGFDELNVIEPPSVGNMKSLADELDYSKMFVEVQTKLDLSEKFKDLTMPIKLAWDKEGDNTIKTIKDTWNEVLSLVHAVGESFRTVWTNGTGQRSLELILQIVQNIVGTFGELARGIREAWQENETGTRIIQSVWNAANNLLTIFRDIWGAIKEWAAGLDWSPLMDAVAGLSESFERLTDPTGALAKIAKGAFDKLLLPLGTWLIEKGLPSAVDLLTSSFDALNVALDFLEPSLQKVYDGLKWIGELTFDNITGLTDVYSSFIDILSGKEVSDEKENRMRDIQDKAIDKLGGKGSTFDTIEKKIEDWGSHGLYDWVEWKKSGITAIGEIGKTIGEQFKKEYEDAMSVSNTDIIPEQNIAAFNKDVKTITDGYSKIGTSASAAYKITGSKSSVGQSGGSDTPKSGIKGFQNDWASGMISMSYGWNNFTNGIKENWRTFKSDWANGIASMETGWSNFTNGVKMKWQTFKDDWASGMTGLSQSVSNEWVKIKTFFTDGWDAIKNGVSQFGEDWSNGWATVKDSVSDMWENAKSDFESGWDTISEGIESFKKAFGSGMDSIKKTTY